MTQKVKRRFFLSSLQYCLLFFRVALGCSWEVLVIKVLSSGVGIRIPCFVQCVFIEASCHQRLGFTDGSFKKYIRWAGDGGELNWDRDSSPSCARSLKTKAHKQKAYCWTTRGDWIVRSWLRYIQYGLLHSTHSIIYTNSVRTLV